MGCMTFQQVKDWAASQVDDGTPFCENCLCKMRKTDEGKWYCSNEMCFDNEQHDIEEDE